MLNSGISILQKKTEAAILLDLIAALRLKSMNTNQVKVDVHMDNKDV